MTIPTDAHPIDWWMVVTNGLWILGISVALAAFSYHAWLARETGRRMRDLFRTRSWRLPWASAIFLASLGWGLSQDERWWGRTFWIVLAAVSGWEILRRALRRSD